MQFFGYRSRTGADETAPVDHTLPQVDIRQGDERRRQDRRTDAARGASEIVRAADDRAN